MSGAMGQAAGLAVGAAVGSVLLPGIGTALGASIGAGTGALSGAAIGGSIGNLIDTNKNISAQKTLDEATLKLNQAQAHAKASETAAIHANNFRQALASQVSLSQMRGGSGSLATQFGNQAYRTFLEDQKAIEAGVKLADVQEEIGEADLGAKTQAQRLLSYGRATVSAFDGLNLNAPRSK